MSTAPIEIRNVEFIGKGSLLGTFTVLVKGTEFNECRIVKRQDGSWFVCGAQRSYEKDGQRRWVPIIRFSDELQKHIQAAVAHHAEQFLQFEPQGDEVPF